MRSGRVSATTTRSSVVSSAGRRCGAAAAEEPALDDAPDRRFDDVGVGRGVHDDATVALLLRDVEEGLTQPLVEAAVLGLEAVRAVVATAPRSGAGKPQRCGCVEHQGEIGPGLRDDDPLEGGQHGGIEGS